MVPWLWVTLDGNTVARRPAVIGLILLHGDASMFIGQQGQAAYALSSIPLLNSVILSTTDCQLHHPFEQLHLLHEATDCRITRRFVLFRTVQLARKDGFDDVLVQHAAGVTVLLY